MEIYLIRHTQPDIEKGVCYGQSDIPLANSFENECNTILKQNPILKDDIAVFSSPLIRCDLLAKKLFKTHIQYDDRLKELNFGDWELKRWDDIDKTELNPWMKDFVNVRCPSGESYTDLLKRVIEFKNSLGRLKYKRVAVVTHAGVIRALLADHKKIALADSFSIEIGYGDVNVIQVDTYD